MTLEKGCAAPDSLKGRDQKASVPRPLKGHSMTGGNNLGIRSQLMLFVCLAPYRAWDSRPGLVQLRMDRAGAKMPVAER
jgi:hypothetical protein